MRDDRRDWQDCVRDDTDSLKGLQALKPQAQTDRAVSSTQSRTQHCKNVV